MNLYNLNNYIEYYQNIFKSVLDNIKQGLELSEDDKKKLGLHNICMCSMGQIDIRTVKACEHCQLLYNISSFKDKFNEFVFTSKNYILPERMLLIKKYDNCNLELEVSGNDIMTKCAPLNSLIINKIISLYTNDFVNTIYSSFYCNRYIFQLKDKLVKFKDLDVKNEHKAIFMETVLSQLFYKLKDLKGMGFNHGDPIIDNLLIKTHSDGSISVLFDELNYSSINFENKRIFNKNIYIINDVEEIKELNYNRETVFKIESNVNYDLLLHNIRHNNKEIYPGVLDFYCFFISILCCDKYRESFFESDVLMENYFRQMFYKNDHPLISNSVYNTTNPDYKSILRILTDISLKKS